MRSDMDHIFTCNLHHACLYSPAAEHHRPLAGTHFTVPSVVDCDIWILESKILETSGLLKF